MVDLQKLDELIRQREVLLTIQSNVDELKDKVAGLKSDLERGTTSNHTIEDNAAAVKAELDALNGKLTNSEHTVEGNVEHVRAELDTLDSLSTTSAHNVSSNTGQVQSAINNLKHNTSSTHTIYVRKVEKNAAGGWAGEAVRYLASGGAAWKRITGRVFGPGTTTSDSIRAMLSRDEFVVRAKATNVVSRMFPGFMEAFNAISSPADLAKLLGSVANSFSAPQVLHLAGGGPATIPAMSGMPGNSETMTVNWQLNGKEYPVRVVRADKPMLHGMLDELDRAKRLAGR